MRALVVDDDPTILRLISSILKKLGFEVSQAGDGREGLEQLAKLGPPNVILVDLYMPEMNGLEFVTAVRSNSVYTDLPIIMVTTEVEMEQMALTFDAGVNEYIMKPFEPIMIQEKLQMVGFGALAHGPF
jgi:two-component system, chemotaxis family, chemotaxis protein CheY